MKEKLYWNLRVRLFQKSAMALAMTFFLIMAFVVVVAFMKKSGSTGMDPAKIQMDRTKFQQDKIKQYFDVRRLSCALLFTGLPAQSKTLIRP